MKTVYIDVLLCVNMFIDYCLLLSVQKFLHIKKKNYRLIVAAFTSSLFSLFIFLPRISFLTDTLIKISSACLIIFICFGRCKIKIFFLRVLLFLTSSILFSGIFTLIHLTLKPKGLIIKNNAVYFDISPIMLIALTLISYCIVRLLTRFLSNKTNQRDTYKLKLEHGSNTVCFLGKIDTCCNVCEPFSSAPVILVEKELLHDIKTDEKKMRIIPFSTLSGNGIIKGFKCDRLYINDVYFEKEVYIGICENKILGEIKCLIGNNVLN